MLITSTVNCTVVINWQFIYYIRPLVAEIPSSSKFIILYSWLCQSVFVAVSSNATCVWPDIIISLLTTLTIFLLSNLWQNILQVQLLNIISELFVVKSENSSIESNGHDHLSPLHFIKTLFLHTKNLLSSLQAHKKLPAALGRICYI